MPTAKKSHKLIFILLAAVAVFIVILLGYVIYNSSIKNQPNKEALKASDNFIKAIESNSIQSAYSNTTDNYKSTNSESAFTDFASKFASKINPDYTVVISNTINSSGPNQNATIIYNGQDKGTAKNEYIKVVLEKVGSNWKVQSISYQQTPYGGNQ